MRMPSYMDVDLDVYDKTYLSLTDMVIRLLSFCKLPVQTTIGVFDKEVLIGTIDYIQGSMEVFEKTMK